MYVYVVSYVMYVDLKPFKGVSTDEIIDNDGVKNQADLQYSTSAKQHYCGHGGKNGYHPPGYIYQAVGSYPTSKHKGRYGVDKFRVSWHMNIPWKEQLVNLLIHLSGRQHHEPFTTGRDTTLDARSKRSHIQPRAQ
ncbi:hypothetical protein RRG08_014965 [Elysia crispata]|uniref:Uncharacterized protein n=1 Tax=Elysia crispata TaxID=231223 RepID=A0AAE1DUW8_9GAST|nr:hypothetical protein RRG08_014965 [Elysia crispata]